MQINKKSSKPRLLHCLLGLLVACLALITVPAGAQDTSEDSEEQTEESIDSQDMEEEAAVLDRVQVTGSLLKREDFTSTSPMQVIDAETQFQAGNFTAADILQETSVAAGTTQFRNQFNGFVIQGGTGVQGLDLRGLGLNRTLVLLNGRRPGGSGTRGSVQAVDLSAIPDIAVNRFEIVLDGSSSIYGSDAVAGVANIITRRSVEQTELSIAANLPQEDGGSLSRFGLITGANFDRGSVMWSAQYLRQEALRHADRDYLNCAQNRYFDAAGIRIDREDRSILAGTELGGCQNNLYANTVLDFSAPTDVRYIPAPDSMTIGPIPGYRPRVIGRYDDDPFNGAFYEDVTNFDFLGNTTAINQQERLNVYATADFEFENNISWNSDFLYSSRETTSEGWRQFFPQIGGANSFPYLNDPDYVSIDAPELQFALPVYPYRFDQKINVEFFYGSTGLSGVFPTESYWAWDVYATYTYSDGDYAGNAIDATRSGDRRFDADAPTWNVFDPCFLSGECRDELEALVGVETEGNTVYDQWQLTGIVTGDLFELPAGTVGSAFGLEYREFSIDDQPDQIAQSGNLFGASSATVTKGSNHVAELFAEVEVPILEGLTGIESLTLNASARYFDYDLGGSDWVYKLGLNWQVVPSVRLRSTFGTSYRAPALFEQFLGNQTGFQNQILIDPCILWEDSTNENVRRNCAAAGVPQGYTGAGSSALVVTGGGVDNLEAETSDAFTAGMIWSPEFANLNASLDYFDIEVNDQIARLGASAIVSGCYAADNFPNAFCDLLTRAPSNDPNFPFNVTNIDDTFVNINSQNVRGLDLNVTWAHHFDWGEVNLEAQSTYQLNNEFQLFNPSLVSGFNEIDIVGDIGTPELVSNLRTTFTRNNWSVTYALQYASGTDDSRVQAEQTTYFGMDPAFRDLTVDAWWSHTVSLLYRQDDWDFLFGIDNLLDRDPDLVSFDVSTVNGNVPLSASQQSLLGRTFFGRIAYRF